MPNNDTPQRTDTERLDWLEREHHSLFVFAHKAHGFAWQVPDWDIASNLRAAIDAAMDDAASPEAA